MIRCISYKIICHYILNNLNIMTKCITYNLNNMYVMIKHNIIIINIQNLGTNNPYLIIISITYYHNMWVIFTYNIDFTDK